MKRLKLVKPWHLKPLRQSASYALVQIPSVSTPIQPLAPQHQLLKANTGTGMSRKPYIGATPEAVVFAAHCMLHNK